MKKILLKVSILFLISQINFAQLEYPGAVNITGSAEIIFTSATDSCSIENIPDAPIRVFRDAEDQIQLIISHTEAYRMKGADFNSLTVDCANGPIWNSDFDTDPSNYNNKEWLTGLYTSDGKTIYSLVHNEHNSSELANWYNAITLAVSNDTGRTYSHSTAPNHLVASIPYKYSAGMGPAGVFEPSNIIHHDGYYYVLLHMESFGLQETGVSIMRTQDLTDPTSWEVWDGEGYNNSFINPYTETGFAPANHIADIISPSEIEKMHGSISWNTYFNKFLLVGSAQKDGVWGFYYSLSEDLINWTVRQIIMEANVNIYAQAGSDVYGYPSIIDHNDTTRNFEVTGQEVYLYYSKWPYGQNYDRTIERIPIKFNKLLVDGFVVTGKGDKEDTNVGDGIATTSAGLTSLRSAIQEANYRPTWLRDSVITISFNIDGTGIQAIKLNNYMQSILYPVYIDGYTQPGALPNTNQFTQGSNAEPLIRINANGNGGLTVESDNTTIRGLIINKHVGPAINLYEVNNCTIEGNFLGTSVDGLTNVTDDGYGIYIEGGQNNIIGGSDLSSRNIILGGISIMGSNATNNIIAGNYIGTDKTGSVALSTNSPGIQIIEGANSNTIGGEYSNYRNLISGNWMYGVWLAGSGVEHNNIFNNFIGTDATGELKLPNNFAGVYITEGAKNNSIGQIDAGNVISGNGEGGITIRNSSNNLIQENYIGTDLTGIRNVGNTGVGILIFNDASNNLIGGNSEETGNIIAFNTGSGIALSENAGKGNVVSRNSIYQNKLFGIDLNWDAMVNENDLMDEDEGPNGLQNFPEITSAQLGDSLIVSGVFYSKPSKAYILQFFVSDSAEANGYGEGQNYIGEVLTPLGPNGQYYFRYAFPFNTYEGKYVTATATDDSNNTSEFSNSVLIREPSAQIQVSESIIEAEVIPNSGVELDLTISNNGAETLNWSASWKQSWLSLSSTSGSVNSNENSTIVVELNTLSLEQNTYFDTLKIISNDLIDSVLYIPVTLNVTKVSTNIEVSTDSLWIGLNKGGEVEKSIYITNNGDSEINWSVTSTERTWMNILNQSDTLAGNKVDTVKISFNTDGLQNGDYPNILNVFSSDPNNPDYAIKILMTVGDYPSIEISTDTLKFFLEPGQEKTLPLTINNKGKSNLEWSVNWTYYSPWIKPSPLNGTLAPNIFGTTNIKVNANEVDSTYGEGVLIVHSNDPNYDPMLVPVIVKIGTATGLLNTEEDLPTEFSLKQNYPNPFNPSTTIKYSIPNNIETLNATFVQIKVYDVLGKEVATLVNKEQSAGSYSIVFDAKELPSGIYIYSMQAGEFTSSRKFILMK